MDNLKPKGVLVLLCLIFGSLSASAQQWQLIWSDEFNGQSLDLNKWSYETGTGVNGDWGTGQLDRATDRPENVAIEQGISGANGGALRITTRKENFMDREYTSGRINTAGKASWGPNHRIVARVWPQDVRTMGQGFAFWMMPDETRPGESTISWPQGGEIDIMEYVGSIPRYNLGTVHYAWDWNNNEWAEWNHGHHGGYYSYEEQQVPDGPEYLRVDLGSVRAINRVVINWENTGRTFSIQTSTDGTNWNVVHTTPNGDGGIDEITFGTVNARFVRVYGTRRANAWGYSIFEFEVYGPNTANLALNRPAMASSVQASDLPASNAVDGSTSTRWSSSLRNPQYQCCDPAPTNDPYVGSNSWHEYGIDWFDDRIEFFIDGNVYHIHYFNDGDGFALDGDNEENIKIINGRRVMVSEFSNLYPEWHPFEHKMYAILSAGVGGGGQTYGGPIVDQATFPVDVYIDWVRVYSNGQDFNPRPAVTLTSPTGAETYSAPASISLAANASDSEGGTISSVAFYDGNQLLHTDNSAPYTYQWNNVSAGVHQVRAVATDNGGATAESSVSVTVNGNNANLALNRPGTASSVVGAFGANNAFDSNAQSRWESEYSDPQWIYVDLGNTYNINRVNILWETALGKDYQVQVSADANNWQTIETVTNNTNTSNDLTGLSGSGRYVRIYGTARNTAYGYSIYSMEVYGSAGNNPGNCGTQNIALNKAAASSSAEGSFTASSAIDGNGNTRWGSSFTNNEWIRVDLGSTYNVCQVNLSWEAAYGSAYEIRLGSNTDINASQVIATVTNGDGGTDEVSTNSAISGRYIWMKGISRGTGYGYSLWEMEVFGFSQGASARKASDQEAVQAQLYPNPVDQELHLQLVDFKSGDEVEILTLSGKQIMTQAVDSKQITLNVSQLRAGVYMIRVKGSSSTTLRFIKE